MSDTLPVAFGALLRSWPELAGFAGDPSAGSELSSLSPHLARDRVAAIAELATRAADPHDAELLANQAGLYDWLLSSERWRRNPDVLSEWSALLLRQTLAAQSSKAEVARLEGWLVSMAAHLPAGREGREHPDPTALDLATETAAGVLQQVDALEGLCATSAVHAARSAVRDHLELLQGVTLGPVLKPLGPDSCVQLFAHRGLAISPRELLERAKEEISRLRAMLPADLGSARQASRQAAGGSFGGVLSSFRELLAAARDASSTASLPSAPASPIEVLATPEALRPSIPGAAVFTPRALAPSEAMVVVLTESEDLSGFSVPRLANLAVHEGHPGHGLQAALANAAGRPWRAVDLCPIPGLGAGLFTCELMEGWAHFAEERLAESGFHDSPERAFVQRDEALWRAVRARVDLGLNLGELDERHAIQALVVEAGLSEPAARAELADYRLQPTYGLSYFWGKLELQRRRAAWRRPEAELYAAILSEGLAPLSMTERWLSGGDGRPALPP